MVRTNNDAKREIERYLSTVSPKVQEVIVIHGYHKGQVLKKHGKNTLKTSAYCQ